MLFYTPDKPCVVCWSNYTSEDCNEWQFVINIDVPTKAPDADGGREKLIESWVRQDRAAMVQKLLLRWEPCVDSSLSSLLAQPC